MITFVALSALYTSFIFADEYCLTGDVQIPDGNNSTIWTCYLPTEDLIIDEISVSANVQHPWIGDLSIKLISPEGSTAILLDRPGIPNNSWVGPWGCGGDNITCEFSDFSTIPAEDTCSLTNNPVLQGLLLPIESLNTFIGTNSFGLWSIEITDHSFIDSGSVNSLCLNISLANDCNANNIPDNDDINNETSEDTNQNNIPDECECLGDLNNDNVINVIDLLEIINQWGANNSLADVNEDEIVDISDLLIAVSNWGICE